MARSRNIKPGFFKNEELGDLPATFRLFFIGLWCVADREGRLEDRPKRLWAELMPYDPYDGDAAMEQLHKRGFIIRYEVAGSRYSKIVNFLKHQSPHCKENPSVIPDQIQESTGQAPDKHRTSTGEGDDKHPLDSWIPGFLDSLIPGSLDSVIPGEDPNPKSCSGPKTAAAPAPDPGAGLALVNGSKEVVPKALNGKIKAEAKTSAIWAAYSAAYFNRYGVEPVRNAKINGQLAQVVDRLGADEAPHVAACYVGSSNAFYVARRHSVDCLLRDCESLRTEWATGTRMSVTEARQMDQHEAGAEAARWVTENKEMLRQMRREGKI